MFNKLRQVFSGKDELTRAALSSNYEDFAKSLIQQDVTFLALPDELKLGIDPKVSMEELLSLVKSAARDLSSREQFRPFRYERDGQVFLPLFSTPKHAEKFVSSYSGELKRIIPFQLLVATGVVVLRAISANDQVILNPRTEHEVALSDIQMEELFRVPAAPVG